MSFLLRISFRPPPKDQDALFCSFHFPTNYLPISSWLHFHPARQFCPVFEAPLHSRHNMQFRTIACLFREPYSDSLGKLWFLFLHPIRSCVKKTKHYHMSRGAFCCFPNVSTVQVTWLVRICKISNTDLYSDELIQLSPNLLSVGYRTFHALSL